MAKIKAEQNAARKKLFGTTDKLEKEKRIRQIYGMGTQQLAQKSNQRTDNWINERGMHLLKLKTLPDSSVVSFRPPRKPEAELGRRTISIAPDSLTPRAVYSGGGRIDLRQSQELPKRPSTVIPRLKQPVYENSRYTMRTRDPNKEVGASTMRYKYFTDKERLKESIESNTSSNIMQPYGIEGRKLHPLEKGSGWIKPDKTFWMSETPGGWNRKDGWNPKHDRSRSMVGDMYPSPLHASEIYTGPSGSAGDFPCMFGVRPGKTSLLRVRDKSKESGPEFLSTLAKVSKHVHGKSIQDKPSTSASQYINKKDLLSNNGNSIMGTAPDNTHSSENGREKMYMGSLRAFSP